MYQSKTFKVFRKPLCIMLCILMTFSFFTVVSYADSSYSTGEIVEFGSYPQTRVTDDVTIAELNNIKGNYSSYGYVTGTGHTDDGKMTSNDFMTYTDVTLDGERYRGVVFTGYRPYNVGQAVNTKGNNSRQDDNGYTYGKVYWFKYESLKWKILNGVTGLVVCVNIIDSQAYNDYLVFAMNDYFGDAEKLHHPNDYENSSIRTWLNYNFLGKAFTAEQRKSILYTDISTPGFKGTDSAYSSADCSDRVFLLSYADVQNTSYMFTKGTDSAVSRMAEATDYAKCQGVFVNTTNEKSYWRLRTAGSNQCSVCYVDTDGSIKTYSATDYTANGIRPAMCLKLSESVLTKCVHTYAKEIIEPTCLKDGYTSYTCTICGAFHRECFVQSLGHIDEIIGFAGDEGEAEEGSDNICDRCGADLTVENCTHLCHQDGIAAYIWKIILVIYKLLGMTDKQYCECGQAHWE